MKKKTLRTIAAICAFILLIGVLMPGMTPVTAETTETGETVYDERAPETTEAEAVTEEPATEPPAPETEAPTEVPETEAPATEAPETEATEAEPPVETQAPVEAPPETEAPVETEAPDPEPAVTEPVEQEEPEPKEEPGKDGQGNPEKEPEEKPEPKSDEKPDEKPEEPKEENGAKGGEEGGNRGNRSAPDWRVSSVAFGTITDGMAPWDADNNPGNDMDADNRIVRTFDRVTYMVAYTTELTTGNPIPVGQNRELLVTVEVPLSQREFNFDLDSMLWMTDPVVTETTDPVTGNVTTTLTGKRILENNANGVVIPGGGELNIVLYASAAQNGTQIEPTVTLSSAEDPGDSTTATVASADIVTVSCRLMLDVAVTKNSYLNRKGTYTDGADSYYGRLQGYGIAIQMLNSNGDKGMKGLLIPDGGTIEFDLTTSDRGDLGAATDHVIWDVNENTSSNSTGLFGRNINWGGLTLRTANSLPDNSSVNYTRTVGSCYLGANVSATLVSDHVVHITLTDYEFDHEQWFFPTKGLSGGSDSNFVPPRFVFSTVFLETILTIDDPTANGSETIYMTASNFTYNDENISNYTTEERTNNNRAANAVLLVPPGNFTIHIRTLHDHLNMIYGDGHGYLGETFGLYDSVTLDGDNPIGALDYLVKFDDEGLEPNGNLDGTSTTMKTFLADDAARRGTLKTLYAAKPDKTGWSSEEELQAACVWDLVYFETTAELYAAGYVPVGYLYELRDAEIYGTNTDIEFSTPTKIKTDAVVGHVYIAVPQVIEWDDPTGVHGLTMAGRGLDPAAYNKTASDPYLPEYPAASHSAFINGNDYRKTTYGENAVVDQIHNSYTHGASVLICAYSPTINPATYNPRTGEPQESFDVDRNQRLVTYRFTPYLSAVGVYDDDDWVEEDLTVTLSIPSTYLHLREDTIRLEGDPTLDGGIISLDIADDGTTTTITMHIADVPLNTALRCIAFECDIGDPGTTHDVYNNQQLDVYAEVTGSLYNAQTITDQDSNYSANWTTNWAKAPIAIIKLSEFAVVKFVTEPLIEVSGHQNYSLRYVNNGTSNIADILAIDVLPYNGDDRGSSFHGTNTLYGLYYDFKGAPLSLDDYVAGNYHVWYTTDASARTKTYTENAALTGWSLASTTVSGTKVLVSGVPANATAIAFDFSCYSKEYVMMQMDCYNPDQVAGDLYANDYEELYPGQAEVVESNLVQVQVLERAISGLVWSDRNANGIQELASKGHTNAATMEQPLSGVTVSLMKVAEVGDTVTQTINGVRFTTALDCFGDPVQPILSGADGSYQFRKLPAGTYYVVFSGFSGDHYVTLQNVGTNDTLDNDSVLKASDSDGYVDSSWIQALTLPRLENMTETWYETYNNDAGIHDGHGSLTARKTNPLPANTYQNYGFVTAWLYIDGLAPNYTYECVSMRIASNGTYSESPDSHTSDANGRMEIMVDLSTRVKMQAIYFPDLPVGATYEFLEESMRTLEFMGYRGSIETHAYPADAINEAIIDYVIRTNSTGTITEGTSIETTMENHYTSNITITKNVQEVVGYDGNGDPIYGAASGWPNGGDPTAYSYDFLMEVFDENGDPVDDDRLYGLSVSGERPESPVHSGDLIRIQGGQTLLLRYFNEGHTIVFTEQPYFYIGNQKINVDLMEPLVVTVTKTNTQQDINLNNRIKMKEVPIRKINQTTLTQTGVIRGIPGVIFSLRDASGNEITQVTTDQNGFATVSVPVGYLSKTYQLVEIQNAEHFDFPNDPVWYIDCWWDANEQDFVTNVYQNNTTVLQQTIDGTVYYCIPNKQVTGFRMPNTGADGTLPLVVPFSALLALMLAAAWVYRKKHQNT